MSDAEKIREEIKQKARAEADTIVRDARSQIETETGKALRQIRSEIADMSVMIASKLIQRNFTKEDNNELIEETLNRSKPALVPTDSADRIFVIRMTGCHVSVQLAHNKPAGNVRLKFRRGYNTAPVVLKGL